MTRRLKDASVVVGALAFFSGAAAGCNVLVGVGDYSIADGEAPDTSTAMPDTGSATGNDAQGDVLVDVTSADVRDGRADAPLDAVPDVRNERATTAGDAGDAADSGDAGDAAELRDVKSPPEASSNVEAGEADGGFRDAEAGPPPLNCNVFVPPTQATFQQLVTTCVMAISCDPFVFPVSLSDCITNDVLRSTGAYACLSTIADCTGWYNCQGDRFSTLDECPGFASFCDTNNVAFDCSPNFFPGLATNCTKQGGTCIQYTDDFGDSRADCVVVPSCTDVDGGGVQCSNNQAIECVNGQGIGLNCTAVDSTCEPGASVGRSCAPNGNTCANPGGSSCSGTSLTTCDQSDQGFTYDCSRAGGNCVTADAGAGCVAPGCSLTSSCTESCDQLNTLTVCVGGAPFTIDCTQYGFTSCGPTGSGNVYCLP